MHLLLSHFSQMRLRVIFSSGLLSAHKNNRERGSQGYSPINNYNCNYQWSIDVFVVSTNLLCGDNDIVFYSGKSIFTTAAFTSETHYYQESAGSSVNCIRSVFTMQLVIEHTCHLFESIDLLYFSPTEILLDIIKIYL